VVRTAAMKLGQKALKVAAPRLWVSLAYRRQLATDVGEHELIRIAEFVPRGRRAIDIGCHNGIYAYHLLRLTNEVVAFEANPSTAAFIRRALPSVRVENVALSSRDGVATLRIPRGTAIHPLDGQATIEPHNALVNEDVDTLTVPTRRLDSYAFDDAGFIKIDVEGHEEGVLSGALGLIGKSRPNLMIEIEERHNRNSIARTAALLGKFGYRAHFFVPDTGTSDWRLAPLSEFDANLHQSDELVGMLDRMPRRRVPYVNNFLFLQE